jgi:hypothetical protein
MRMNNSIFQLAKTWKAYSKIEAQPKGVGHNNNND